MVQRQIIRINVLLVTILVCTVRVQCAFFTYTSCILCTLKSQWLCSKHLIFLGHGSQWFNTSTANYVSSCTWTLMGIGISTFRTLPMLEVYAILNFFTYTFKRIPCNLMSFGWPERSLSRTCLRSSASFFFSSRSTTII